MFFFFFPCSHSLWLWFCFFCNSDEETGKKQSLKKQSLKAMVTIIKIIKKTSEYKPSSPCSMATPKKRDKL